MNKSWIIAAGVAFALCVGVWQLWLPPRLGSTAQVTFTVSSGWGGGRIAAELQSAGLIRSVFAFIVYTNFTRTGDQLKAGTYELSPSMSVPQIVSLIASGRGLSDDLTVTIPEGTNIWDLDHILLGSKLITKAGQFSSSYGASEGRLFPNTYRFAKDALPADIASRMQAELIAQADVATTKEIIIASILEKEAKTPQDMAMVSGIIAKRMARGMPLQIDATVGYGWCVRTHGYTRYCDVTQAPIATEIKIDGPYNTYARTGLPVAPISNPGLAALNAAAHPTDTPYLYYLSTRDGSQLIYAKTLDEHLANRKKYLGF